MTNRKITVLIVEPGKRPRAAEIDDDLDTYHAIVGGYIETVYPFSDHVVLVCNDEGKFDGSLYNRPLRDQDIIFGTFFIAGLTDSNEDFDSLTPEQIARYMRVFRYPGRFIEAPDTKLT